MQKIMVCLGRPNTSDAAVWNSEIEQLMTAHCEEFSACSYSLIDDDVAPAFLLQMLNTAHPKDAVLSIWVENPYQLKGFFNAVSKLGSFQAYSVMESSAIPASFDVGRVEGMCQVAFLKKPEDQSRADWHQAWLGNHTQIAIDTQSTFGYRQNVVAFSLPLDASTTPPWPLMDAIVEENFPAKAMTSREAFFDAEGDSAEFERRQQVMMQSCFNFIDFEAFDCVPMSQYIVRKA